ncbi:MAG: FtsW/RodA/SpoVE family cell cycle protein, partial [Myxococcota bacterium]
GLIGLYTVVVVRGVKIAIEAEDDYGSYIAFGLSALVAMQVLLNLSVAMAILPTKGLTLPFISYGGSSLLVSAGAMGILLSVSRGSTHRVPTRFNTRVAEGPEESATAAVVIGADEPELAEAMR